MLGTSYNRWRNTMNDFTVFYEIPSDVTHEQLMLSLDRGKYVMDVVLREVTDALVGREVTRLTGLLAGAVCKITDVAVSPSVQGYVIMVRASVHPDAPKTWSDKERAQRMTENVALLVLDKDCVLLNRDDTP